MTRYVVYMVRKIMRRYWPYLTSHNTHFTNLRLRRYKYQLKYSPLLCIAVTHRMACVGLYLYIVVLYQNGLFTLLRKRMGPVREKRRGLFWLVPVPAETQPEWALYHSRAFITCWELPLIIRGARGVWCYFAKYVGGIFYIIYIGKCNRAPKGNARRLWGYRYIIYSSAHSLYIEYKYKPLCAQCIWVDIRIKRQI